MDQDEQKQADEVKRQNEAEDSELSDQDLENVAGGGKFEKMPPVINNG